MLRSPEKDLPGGWPTGPEDFRRTRYVPAEYVFTMSMIIGEVSAAMISSRRENFAVVVESLEYVEMHRNLFEVLWAVAAEELPPARCQESPQQPIFDRSACRSVACARYV